VNPGLCQDRADQTGSAGGCQELGPGRQAGNRTTSAASAGSQVRPGPRLRRYAQTAAKPRKQDSCRSFSDPPCRYGAVPIYRSSLTRPRRSGLSAPPIRQALPGPAAVVRLGLGDAVARPNGPPRQPSWVYESQPCLARQFPTTRAAPGDGPEGDLFPSGAIGCCSDDGTGIGLVRPRRPRGLPRMRSLRLRWRARR
jgi:hypothetical protein